MSELSIKNKVDFTWMKFYMDFADKLLFYKDNRDSLLDIIKKSFEEAKLNFPFIDKGIIVEDIDPFSVIGCFNKGLKDSNRQKIAKSIGDKIGVSTKIPDGFDGIPVLNNMSSWFFGGRDSRGENDIQNLWNVFETGIKLSDTQSEKAKAEFMALYNLVLKQSGVKWNLTMGLYWIRPYFFVNLDGTNRKYLLMDNNPYKKDLLNIANLKTVPTANEYLKMIELCKRIFNGADSLHSSFPEISRGAWLTTQDKDDDAIGGSSNASFLKWFSPIIKALKELDGSGSPSQVREQIIEDLNLSDEIINEVRGKNNTNKFANEVAFARNYLVYAGYIDKTIKGIWQLTQEGYTVMITKKMASDIFKKYAKQMAKKRKDDDTKTKYWIYSAGSNSYKWDEFYTEKIMAIGWSFTGDLNNYNSKSELNTVMKESYGEEYSHKNNTHALWQFANDIRVGDVVYVKKGRDKIIGRGIVESDYIYDINQIDFPHNRKVKWTHNGEWDHPGKAVVKALTDITSYVEYVRKLEEIVINESNTIAIEEVEKVYPIYTGKDFLDEVYMSPSKYTRLANNLKSKKNIILQGAPGVGKTYSAKRLAYSVMGVKDVSRVMLIQFHQSYSYEDFIMGYRPDGQGFKLSEGPFYEFCKTALDDDENDYFFIIDEINRGNLSKIFGELLMLIENDKRGQEIRLMYSNELFSVPKNVHIIGMMNTADRSLAMIDYALRRRFSFFNFEPAFDSRGFKDILLEVNNEKFNRLIEIIKELNVDIVKDDSLGNGFQIGHSYFCPDEDVTDEWLESIVEYEIIPLLKEYWFDETSKVDNWIIRLRGVLNDKS